MFDNLSVEVLQSVRSAIIVTDATVPDDPIVHVNPAFEILTGYAADELLGKNCRLLQGTDRDQTPLPMIRHALINSRPVHAILRNYRKDGSLFYNELLINPIFQSDGRVTHFVGCQNEISSPNDAHLLQDAQLRYGRLTAREREIFIYVANGYQNKQIAKTLDISHRTVEKHRASILRKFEAKELTILVRYAIVLGLPLGSSQIEFPSI